MEKINWSEAKFYFHTNISCGLYKFYKVAPEVSQIRVVSCVTLLVAFKTFSVSRYMGHNLYTRPVFIMCVCVYCLARNIYIGATHFINCLAENAAASLSPCSCFALFENQLCCHCHAFDPMPSRSWPPNPTPRTPSKVGPQLLSHIALFKNTLLKHWLWTPPTLGGPEKPGLPALPYFRFPAFRSPFPHHNGIGGRGG